jgi:hypothetical protein
MIGAAELEPTTSTVVLAASGLLILVSPSPCRYLQSLPFRRVHPLGDIAEAANSRPHLVNRSIDDNGLSDNDVVRIRNLERNLRTILGTARSSEHDNHDHQADEADSHCALLLHFK